MGSRISPFQDGYHGNGGPRRAWSFFRIWREFHLADPKRRTEIKNMSSDTDIDSLSKTNERPFGAGHHVGIGAPRQGTRLISDLGVAPSSPGWELRRPRRFRAPVSLLKKPNTGETAFCSCGLRVRILAAEGTGYCVSCGSVVYPGGVV